MPFFHRTHRFTRFTNRRGRPGKASPRNFRPELLEKRELLVGDLFAAGAATIEGPIPQESEPFASTMKNGGPSERGANSLREITVASWNLYLGGDVGPVINALFTGDSNVIVPAMTDLWNSVRATNFHDRAAAIADQIAATRSVGTQPSLIGLQEAFVWRTGPAHDPAPATHVEFDFTQILLDTLNQRGLHYAVVADTTQTDTEIPGVTHRGIIEDIRLTDHGVILARTDLPKSQLKLSNVQEANFQTKIVLPLPGGPLTIERGWNSVDAKIRGKKFRFINTHLESFNATVQELQGNELLNGPADTKLPVVMVGDFNSDADPNSPRNQTDTYENLIAASFRDAWSVTQPDDPGFTCCQAEDLLNTSDETGSRIDLVLFRGTTLTALATDLLGEDPADRAASGLWPSDHAGVVATMGIVPKGHAKLRGEFLGMLDEPKSLRAKRGERARSTTQTSNLNLQEKLNPLPAAEHKPSPASSPRTRQIDARAVDALLLSASSELDDELDYGSFPGP